MNDKERIFLILGLADSIITVAFVARLVSIVTVDKTRMIIQRHYSGYRSAIVAMAIGTLIMIATTVYIFLKYRKARLQARGETAVSKKHKAVKSRKLVEKLDTPEEIYGYLKSRLGSESHISDSLRISYKRILAQLDEMNSLQDRLEQLLEVNNSTASLNETRDLLQNVENAICLGVRKAINFQIAGGEAAFLVKIETTQNDNRKLLDEAEGVLINIAEFINSGEGDITHISRKIRDYRQTIQAFLKEENEDDDEEDNRSDFGTGTHSVARGMRG